jgi:hypothetical protein
MILDRSKIMCVRLTLQQSRAMWVPRFMRLAILDRSKMLARPKRGFVLGARLPGLVWASVCRRDSDQDRRFISAALRASGAVA